MVAFAAAGLVCLLALVHRRFGVRAPFAWTRFLRQRALRPTPPQAAAMGAPAFVWVAR
jgi:hypothetical protein